MGRRDRLHLPHGSSRARRAAPTACSPSPSARSATSIELYGDPRGEDRRHAERRRPRLPPDGARPSGAPYVLFVGGDPAAQGSAGRGRGARAARGDARSSSSAPEKRGGDELRRSDHRLGLERRVDLRGHVDAGGARRRSTAARPASSSRRATRASACRCSRRWPRGTPVVAAAARALREVAGDAAVSSSRATRRARAAGSGARSPTASASSPPGSSARGAVLAGTRPPAARSTVYREVLA